MLNVKEIVTLFVPLVILTSGVHSNQECITPRNTPGRCVFIHQCEVILNIIRSNPNPTTELTSHLREYNCGYVGHVPKVCCEKDAAPCNCTDLIAGVCVPVSRCNPYLSLLLHKPFLSDKTVHFLRENECEFGDKARVCCPIIFKKKEDIKEIKKVEKLPQPGECGVQDIEDKLWGGNAAGISEFPWMALLEYGSYNEPKLACGGTLINDRFVLTAAHCVVGPEVSRYGNLQRIRLGEYDIKNSTDCVNTAGEYDDCSDPPLRIDVEKIISHEGFDLRNRNRSHDIALVKMAQAVKYTEFIRPICLPPPYYTLPTKYFVAGWGSTETSNQSNLKLKLSLPHFEHSKCRSVYAGLAFPVYLSKEQICAGGEIGKDSCTGDSGGPLMAPERNGKHGQVWYQTGIVSFGPTPCGKNQPGVYTNVLEYLPWIHRIVTSTY